ncbi:MAG: nicotinate-nucleotide adenylyltransferase [Candidatus Omnitrophica bacterium]|nr:nicotinate-nucleotide adenylyltransferase [Candidatus Omnitrophota bacterium]
MKRIGILGGTFNPIHIGHLTIAEMVHEQLNLDKVIFVPSNLPPHKSSKNVVSAGDRCHMIRLAVRGNPRFEVSDYEIKKGGKSYSIETVNHFRDSYPPGTKLFFIIGSDVLPTLRTWKRINDIFKIVSFVSVNRPGFKEKKSKVKLRSITVPGLQTSSSYVRKRITSGKTVKYLVPDNVLSYIEKKRLYKINNSRKEKHGKKSER